MSLPENPYQAPETAGRPEPQEELKPLGSLAQSARGKELGRARTILFVLGVLSLAGNGFLFAHAPVEIDDEFQKEIAAQGPGFVVDQAALAEQKANSLLIVRVFYAGMGMLGVLFIIFGFVLRSHPVPITITSLVLYLLTNVILALLNPMSLIQGIIFKVIIIVALFKAIQAAIASKRESSIAPALEM